MESSSPVHVMSVPAQSFVPMPTTVVIIRLDPVATLKDLQDADVRKAASAIQTKQYVVYTHDIVGYPTTAPWHTCHFRLIGRRLPKNDPKNGVEPSMCIPLMPNTQHPEGRISLPFNKPLPWSSCYLHTFPMLDLRMPNSNKDSTAATFVPTIKPVAQYDYGPCKSDRMRQHELLGSAERVRTSIRVMSDDEVASEWRFLLEDPNPDPLSVHSHDNALDDLEADLDTSPIPNQDCDHLSSIAQSITTGPGLLKEPDCALQRVNGPLSVFVRNTPETVSGRHHEESEDDILDQSETSSPVDHHLSDSHAHSNPVDSSKTPKSPSVPNGSFSDCDESSYISSEDGSEWLPDIVDSRPVFSTLPMVDVEYDLSAILDFGEPEELLAELAAIKAIEEAYYAAKNEEAVKPNVYEATAEAPGQRFSFKEITSRLRRFLIRLRSVSSAHCQSKETAAAVSDVDSHHETKSRTAADEIREKWELENPEKESTAPLPSRLSRLKARFVTARTCVGRTVRDAVCCA